MTAAFGPRINDSAVYGEVVGIITIPLFLKDPTQLCPQAHCLNTDHITALPESLPQPLMITSGALFLLVCISVNETQMWEQYLLLRSVRLDAANDAINISLMRAYGCYAWRSVEETRRDMRKEPQSTPLNQESSLS